MTSPSATVDDAPQRTIVLVICFLAIFIDGAAVPATAGAVAQMAHAFVLSPLEAAWASIGFNVSYNLTVLLSLWLIGQHGKRGYFRGSLLGYATALLVLALAPTAGIAIAARVVEGACLGGLFASALLTMVGISPAKRLPFVFALFTLISLAAPALGPLLAAIVLHAAGWRCLFAAFAFLPLGGGLIAGAYMKDVDPPRPLFFDTASFGSVAMFLLAFYYVTSIGATVGLRDVSLASTAMVGAIALAWFLLRDFRLARNPFVDVAPLHIPLVARGIAACIVLGIILGATASLISFAQEILHLDPLGATALAAARFIGAIPGAWAVYAIATRNLLDNRGTTLIGLAVVLGSFGVQALGAATHGSIVLHVMVAVVQGFGLSLALGPFASLLFGAAPHEQFGALALLFKIALLVGSALAVPLIDVSVTHNVTANVSYAILWTICACLAGVVATIVATLRTRDAFASPQR
jgi:DHA2 family methylenomycin A resistance protein-like MFS transporter